MICTANRRCDEISAQSRGTTTDLFFVRIDSDSQIIKYAKHTFGHNHMAVQTKRRTTKRHKISTFTPSLPPAPREAINGVIKKPAQRASLFAISV